MLRSPSLSNFEVQRDPLTQQIIGGAIEVHRALGPGLQVIQQVSVPVVKKGIEVEAGYRVDMVIDDSVVVELKAVESVLPVHEAQLLTYMRLLNKRVGLLLNFNVSILTNGIHRWVL